MAEVGGNVTVIVSLGEAPLPVTEGGVEVAGEGLRTTDPPADAEVVVSVNIALDGRGVTVPEGVTTTPVKVAECVSDCVDTDSEETKPSDDALIDAERVDPSEESDTIIPELSPRVEVTCMADISIEDVSRLVVTPPVRNKPAEESTLAEEDCPEVGKSVSVPVPKLWKETKSEKLPDIDLITTVGGRIAGVSAEKDPVISEDADADAVLDTAVDIVDDPWLGTSEADS
ncbi:hypothetical protein ACOMHN_038597 [Nucella lapillus]